MSRPQLRLRSPVAFAIVVFTALPAFAQTAMGQGLLDWVALYILAPLGIFAVIIALAASIFRPEMVRSAVYAALIAAVMYFIIKQAGSLQAILRNG